jgi:hypothetical protein
MIKGDLRLSANRKCWPKQAKKEVNLAKTLKAKVWAVVSAHPCDAKKNHNFIDSQKKGITTLAHRLNGCVMAVVWKRRWGTGRVFYSSLGHEPELVQLPEVNEILTRGMLWASANH